MKKIFTYFIVLGLLTTSCSDFLDKKPVGKIEQTEAFKTVADCQSAINGVYALWNSSTLYSDNLTLIPDVQCDMAYSVVGYTNQLGTMYSWSFTSTDGSVTNIFAQLYRISSTVNLLLENVDNVNIKNEQEQKELNNILGAAYFCRAMAYTELVKLYAAPYDPAKASQQLGVSIWTEFTPGHPARATLAENYTQILKDLEKASALVNEDKADSKTITKGAVDALYARVYLYMQNWEAAAAAATKVINNPKYRLADATDIAGIGNTDFFKMWKFDTDNEIIWKLAYTKNDLPGSLGYRFCYLNGNVYRIDYSPAKAVLDLYDPADGRFYTYFRPADLQGNDYYVVSKYPGNPNYQTGSGLVYNNMPKVFRLAEMYLIRAEAYAKMSGKEAEANNDLKTLRENRIKNYVHANLTGGKLIQEIKEERVRELYMEGHRLYDLKRYGEGFARSPQVLSIAPDDRIVIKPNDFRFVWPIPSHEMDANPNAKQNPGY